MNSGANAHGKQITTSDRLSLTVELPVTSDSQRGNELVFKSLTILSSMLGDLKVEWPLTFTVRLSQCNHFGCYMLLET